MERFGSATEFFHGRSSVISRVSAPENAWRGHILSIFESLDILPDGPTVEAIAASVGHYCGQYHPAGVQESDLVLLIARACCSVNQSEYARRVLGSVYPHCRHVTRWTEILSELHHFPSLLPYFSNGIIRPADWAGARLDRMWMLDFSRLSLSDAERHEMVLQRSVRALVEAMFVCWDSSDGEGVLGLKGLTVLAGMSASRGKKGRPDELVGYIGGLFRREQLCRGWKSVPKLMLVS